MQPKVKQMQLGQIQPKNKQMQLGQMQLAQPAFLDVSKEWKKNNPSLRASSFQSYAGHRSQNFSSNFELLTATWTPEEDYFGIDA
jgi:hypothetical protein